MYRLILSGISLGIALSITVVLLVSYVSQTPDPIPIVIVKPEIHPERFVYKLYIHNESGAKSIGTGFKVQYKDKIYLMSAQHVCDLFIKDNYPLVDTEFGLITTKVLSVSGNSDLCLLQAPQELLRNPDAIPISEENLKKGDSIKVIGFPHGMFKLIVHDTYIGKQKLKYTGYVFHNQLLDASNYFAIPGQSGGPVMNERSELVGVLVFKNKDKGLFVPLHFIKEFLSTRNQ